MSKELQHIPPVETSWQAEPVPQLAVELIIHVPEHATVSRHAQTGQIQFTNLRIEDLISLRDALTKQIAELGRQELNGWEPL